MEDNYNDVKGIWIDKRNGRKINVNDCIIDGDNMVITSSIGLIPVNIFSDYFIRMSDEQYNTNTYGILPETPTDKINEAINVGIDPDMKVEQNDTYKTVDTDTNENNQNSSNQNSSNQNSSNQNSSNKANANIENSSINNYALIDKVFKKNGSKTEIEFTIDTTNWPLSELKMLINIFDVTVKDIATYIIENHTDKTSLINEFTKFLENKLNI